MGKRLHWLLALLFLALCVLTLGFLHIFTRSDSPFQYPAWEAGWVVAADGSLRDYDLQAGPPALEEGEYVRLSTTVPSRAENQWLIFEVTGLELALFLDGEELYCSTARLPQNTAGQGQVQIPLPVGPAAELVMDLRPLGDDESGMFPPLLRLTADLTDYTGTLAYANLYAFPAGASALAMILVWGLFLLGLAYGKPDWSLLPLTLAAGGLTVYRLCQGTGYYFLPAGVLAVLTWPGMGVLTAAALMAYLLMNRRRAFWRALALAALWSVLILVLAVGASMVLGGRLDEYLGDVVRNLFQGHYDISVYWVTLWLVAVCVFLSTRSLVRTLARTQAETQALQVKNQLALDSYHSIQRKLRESAALRHEFSHQLATLTVLAQQGDLAALRSCLEELSGQSGRSAQAALSQNPIVNAILRDAQSRAEDLGIRFEASAPLPEGLAIPDRDLCALLMNMLDNALEGAAGTPEGTRPYLRFSAKLKSGFLVIRCENSYSGRLSADDRGHLRSTKEDPDSHGFGMSQMSAIAEKYMSILDVSYTGQAFTVQTALKLPETP